MTVKIIRFPTERREFQKEIELVSSGWLYDFWDAFVKAEAEKVDREIMESIDRDFE